ncbi:hypothetical protein [Fuchsiella alkaliacetigena]|uniref:hypothetical protein n=1 Tax=Fuchsiella alkaliacetigena TaxID=957042 RepID=UPI00200B6150|nr:hypothetical protein [Fuchsiella alkaliacetigena]MCK8825084.1 hypothetical protein [Fuchsiella alkaliacetigena]
MNFFNRRFWEGMLVGGLTSALIMTVMEKEDSVMSKGVESFTNYLQKMNDKMEESTVLDKKRDDNSVTLTNSKAEQQKETDNEIGAEMDSGIEKQMEIIQEHLDNLDNDEKSH